MNLMHNHAHVHFAQAQTHDDNRVLLQAGFIEALYIKTPICTRIPIPMDRLAILTNYPSVTNDQALEEIILTLFHQLVHSCFQFIGIRIQLPVMMSSKANFQ